MVALEIMANASADIQQACMHADSIRAWTTPHHCHPLAAPLLPALLLALLRSAPAGTPGTFSASLLRERTSAAWHESLPWSRRSSPCTPSLRLLEQGSGLQRKARMHLDNVQIDSGALAGCKGAACILMWGAAARETHRGTPGVGQVIAEVIIVICVRPIAYVDLGSGKDGSF